MFENTKMNATTTLSPVQKFLSFVLGCGVILAAMHGAFIGNNHVDLTPASFTSKVANDFHVHNDFSLQQNHIMVDPRSLRHIRSEGDKTAANDSLRGNWDVYQV